ncbi:hypothetical protein [Nostoc linckia]|uniref:hypothetical protein n=1 Tax=Nostoc linckia TaxID=92942 RepID=UPI000C00093F|nr:hypothetical protein [Nostoc linckia]
MAPGTDDPKDLGSKKIFDQEISSEKNEGFSGENLPKNYDPSKDKLKMELEKDEDGDVKTMMRARDVDEKKAPAVDSLSGETQTNGKITDKSRGTENDAEDVETYENQDFNSDIDKDRYPTEHPDNHKNRGNIDLGE